MSGCPRTSKLESKVSPHIEEQLPEFVRSEHPLFATFVKHYYQFLEAGCLTLGGSNEYLAQETLTNNLILDNNDDKIVIMRSWCVDKDDNHGGGAIAIPRGWVRKIEYLKTEYATR